MIRLRHLVKDTSVYGLVSATRSLVGLLLVPVYTRVFLPGEYGQIDTLTTLVAFLTLAATLGMDTAAALYFYDNAGAEDRGAMIATDESPLRPYIACSRSACSTFSASTGMGRVSCR